ncbi:unnamed protein product [Arabidopsis halleri]
MDVHFFSSYLCHSNSANPDSCLHVSLLSKLFFLDVSLNRYIKRQCNYSFFLWTVVSHSCIQICLSLSVSVLIDFIDF